MKLLKAHIFGFGNLHDMDISFDPFFSPFIEENGYGKSTLAAFIKAIIYGLSTARNNAKELAERARYCPVSGGKFGGSLRILWKGTELTIERIFDPKSVKKDSMRVLDIDGSQLSNIDGASFDVESLGPLLMGIDVDSFERTCFAFSSSLAFERTEDIRSKMHGLIIDEKREYTYEEASKKLDERLHTHRRNAGDYGKSAADQIDKRRREITALQKEEREIGDRESQLPGLIDELKQIDDDLSDIGSKLSLLRNKDEVVRLDGKAKEAEEALAKAKAQYPSGFPSEDDMAALSSLGDRESHCAAIRSASSLTEEELRRIKEIKTRYGEEGPSESLYDEAKKRWTLLSEAQGKPLSAGYDASRLSELEMRLPILDEAKLKELETLLGDFAHEEKMLSELREAPSDFPVPSEEELAEADEASAGVKETQEALSKLEASHPKIGFAEVLLIILTLGLYLIAIKKKEVAFADKKRVFESQLEAYRNAVSAILDKYGIDDPDLPSAVNKLKDMRPIHSPGIAYREEAIKKKRMEVTSLLEACGYRRDNGHDFAELSGIVTELSELRTKKTDFERAIAQRDEKVGEQSQALYTLLAPYFPDQGPFEEKIRHLKEDIEIYKKLSDRGARFQKSSSGILSIKEEAEAVLNKCGLSLNGRTISQTYADIEAAKKEIARTQQDFEARKAEASQFRLEHGFSDSDPLPDGDLFEAEEERQSLIQRRRDISERIDEIESDISKKDDIAARIKDLESEIETLKGEKDLIDKAKQILGKAYEALEKKYIGPTKTRFLNYLKEMSPRLAKGMNLGLDYGIRPEIDGSIRDEEYLSDGEKAIVLLAIRFSVMDGLFPDGDWFLVLDDPFVFLDEKNMIAVAPLLKKLASQGRQIIYFACHKIRTI